MLTRLIIFKYLWFGTLFFVVLFRLWGELWVGDCCNPCLLVYVCFRVMNEIYHLILFFKLKNA